MNNAPLETERRLIGRGGSGDGWATFGVVRQIRVRAPKDSDPGRDGPDGAHLRAYPDLSLDDKSAGGGGAEERMVEAEGQHEDLVAKKSQRRVPSPPRPRPSPPPSHVPVGGLLQEGLSELGAGRLRGCLGPRSGARCE